MSKTIQSMINDAQSRMDMWLSISQDDEALADRNKSINEAVILANYFEGKRDGLIDAMRINQ